MDIFALYSAPDTNSFQELVIATTVGCDLAAGLGACTTQGLVGNTSIFKIVHDVDFLANLTKPIKPKRSPCQHLQAAYRSGGIPDKEGNLMTVDPKGRCSGDVTVAGYQTLAKEYEVLVPPSRDIIGRSRHKHDLHPSVVTLDFHGRPSQNGEYLNPVVITYPEFVEINLNALQTPLIFAGELWNLDRRLGPGGCDGVCEPTTGPGGIPVGDPSMRLDPFPFSNLDSGTQVGFPGLGGVPVVAGYADQKGRILSYWPLTPAHVLPWPPADPPPLPIDPALPAGLMCHILSGVDTDGDGVDDAIDNCTLVANADQRDTNGNGYGNMCDGDINTSGGVAGLEDYFAFLDVFGKSAASNPPVSQNADFNGNGVVGLEDYFRFLEVFGKMPGPSCCGK